MARLQAEDQQIVAGPMSRWEVESYSPAPSPSWPSPSECEFNLNPCRLLGVDFGAPLHCLVIAGQVHVVEEEMVACYRLKEGA